MEFLGEKIEDGKRIMNLAIEKYNPKLILVGYSGGGDSLTTAKLLSHLGIPFKNFFCNTGIVIKEARDFVVKTCKDNDWDLIEQKPTYKTYKQQIVANGFPGPDAHSVMYINLKEKSIKDICRRYKNDVIVVTGVRKSESERRNKNITSEIQEYEGIKWVAPIMNWDQDDKDEFLDGCETNPVSKCLSISGDCCCGAYARKGELAQIKEYYPEMGETLQDYQELLFRIGFTWGWDDEVPIGKEFIEIMDKIFPGYGEIYIAKKIASNIKKKVKNKLQNDLFEPLCQKCTAQKPKNILQ